MSRTFWKRCAVVSGLIAFIVCSGSTVRADRLEMIDGSVIWGRFIESTQDTITFEFIGGVAIFAVSDVFAVNFLEPALPGEAALGAEISAYRARPVTVPAGTRILARTIDGISSRIYGAGSAFTAVLAGDVVAEGMVLASRGTVVTGRLTRMQRARRAGRSSLTVELTSITVGGIVYPIVTSSVRAAGEDTRRRASRYAGRRFGSRGLRRGITVGAAGPVRTSGWLVEIPAGTLLEFRLGAPFIYER